jgi:hypothetical protein
VVDVGGENLMEYGRYQHCQHYQCLCHEDSSQELADNCRTCCCCHSVAAIDAEVHTTAEAAVVSSTGIVGHSADHPEEDLA